MALFPVSAEPTSVEEMLLERGILVSYETIRRWGKKFGLDYARRLWRNQPRRDDIWGRFRLRSHSAEVACLHKAALPASLTKVFFAGSLLCYGGTSR